MLLPARVTSALKKHLDALHDLFHTVTLTAAGRALVCRMDDSEYKMNCATGAIESQGRKGLVVLQYNIPHSKPEEVSVRITELRTRLKGTVTLLQTGLCTNAEGTVKLNTHVRIRTPPQGRAVTCWRLPSDPWVKMLNHQLSCSELMTIRSGPKRQLQVLGGTGICNMDWGSRANFVKGQPFKFRYITRLVKLTVGMKGQLKMSLLMDGTLKIACGDLVQMWFWPYAEVRAVKF